MNRRRLSTISANSNCKWLAERFGMNYRTNGGIDLVDNEAGLGVEVKSRARCYRNFWTIHAYQFYKFPEDKKGYDLYWAFLLYGLSKHPRKIRGRRDFDKSVVSRTAWIVNWDWVSRMPVSHAGTDCMYVHGRDINEVNAEYFCGFELDGGVLYVPRESELTRRLAKSDVCVPF